MAASPGPRAIKVSLSTIAKTIDHSLLHPTMTDAEIEAGLQTARSYNVAAACIKPYSIAQARRVLAGSDVRVCAVVGFPHGSSTRAAKVAEAQEAVRAGAAEVDVVVNVGKVLGGQWGYVEEEIAAVNEVVTSTAVGDGAADGEGEKKKTAILKVIFENDYLQEEHIARLCEICTRVKVAFVKTSTGYAMVKQSNGMYSYKGPTVPHLKLMREKSGPEVQIKAAGGVRTLDDFLFVMSLGVTRVGATATAAILEDAKERGIGETQVEVALKEIGSVGGGY
ncbi:putative deoxyribose-phosphate aldolase protein [Phaeoacremonium minimum UCRPA7]|uniref:deoxyribose-phosphate aldolase n=1 Tax=Phaeoacremonium minimum (strain UCR-PA7) TaxID=1286976 RepID=R8BPR5_PHAM7|nr:putative deoxyribose-phosphate aldolase protein [Phaeoacremonium minimum UCRPA7]EOO01295.1 putative deoxyribose-phosphate aldolase protein [Phaeoacremonium minimum UCRPA7]